MLSAAKAAGFGTVGRDAHEGWDFSLCFVSFTSFLQELPAGGSHNSRLLSGNPSYSLVSLVKASKEERAGGVAAGFLGCRQSKRDLLDC